MVSFFETPVGRDDVDEGSDEKIMLRVRDGHVEDLGILFERHHVALLNFFHRATGSRAASEDLVQEVFVRVMRYRESFRADGAGFAPWMYTLARSVRVDHIRRAARRRREEPWVEEPTSDQPSAQQRMERDDSVVRLRRALMLLDADDRELLILRCFHLKKFTEVAEILGCTVGAAKVRAHRAIRDLRRIYDGKLERA